jgi:DNA-binding NarL/FixJ family response regulator
MDYWKTIPGYENYAISTKGEVKSLRFNRLLKPANSDAGYLYVNLVNNKINKSTAVHKLVIENFGEGKPAENYVVDHLDGNKNNNAIENLQWVSVKENTLRYYNNSDKKAEILRLHNEGLTSKQITEKVGLHYSTIRQTILRAGQSPTK